jgi:3',5'-cyclic AMP phosphodiesterase CpdA
MVPIMKDAAFSVLLAAILISTPQVAGPQTGRPGEPLFSFGVIADIQYADKESVGARHYRASMKNLEECVTDLNGRNLAFTIQLGDLVDDCEKENVESILAVYSKLEMKKYHVLGNHDLCAKRSEVTRLRGMKRGYYDFLLGNWRFVVLDGLDISTAGGWARNSDNYRKAENMLQKLRREGQENAQDWNGAMGSQQRTWLEEILRRASGQKEKVVVFCHLPAISGSADSETLLWNHDEIVEILESYDSVVAYFSGHDHKGGYRQHKGIHYVTLPGMVEAPRGNAYAVVEVYEDRLALRGKGRVPSRTLKVAARD